MFVSTGPSTKKLATFEATLLEPIPEPNHLWIPAALPAAVAWPDAEAPLWRFVNAAMAPLVGRDCSDECRAALENFPIALEPEAGVLALQLHRGPTLSFKDVGCRVAAELHRTFLRDGRRRVLVATSGDTGSAAAHAFDDVCVLYPGGRVSRFQEQQMLGHESAVCLAVPGDFDDCQRLAKQVLRDGGAVSSNNVSLARLLPQVGIYAWAAVRAPHRVFFVPSGNYGNATACLMAKRMGAPIERIHLACNENGRALVATLRHGQPYEPAPTTVRTPATAMDVGRPSNAVRLFHYLRGHRDVSASVVTNQEIRQMTDRATCPHTSCALHAALRADVPGPIVVRTADAAKFVGANTNPRPPYVLLDPSVLTQRACRSLLLVGLPGADKTTLSTMLGGVDSDCEMVHDLGKKDLAEAIAMFKTPEAFLEHEGNFVVRLLLNHAVVATGASAAHSQALRRHLKDSSDVLVVLLEQGGVAAVVPSDNSVESSQLKHMRRLLCPLFRSVAHLKLRTDMWDPRRCAAALRSTMRFFGFSAPIFEYFPDSVFARRQQLELLKKNNADRRQQRQEGQEGEEGQEGQERQEGQEGKEGQERQERQER